MINTLASNIYAVAAQAIIDAAYHHYDPAKGRAHFFATSNLALPAARFRELGGFAQGWSLAAAEDREFCFRWLQRGWPMTYAPEATVYHSHALNFRSFAQLYFRYGRGAYRYHRSRRAVSGAGNLRPDWGFYGSCFRRPWRTQPFAEALAITALLAVWQIANAAGFLAERFRGGED